MRGVPGSMDIRLARSDTSTRPLLRHARRAPRPRSAPDPADTPLMCNPVSQPVSTATLSLDNAVSVRVLRKALDAQVQEGSQIVQMIKNAAVQPARAEDGRLDVYA